LRIGSNESGVNSGISPPVPDGGRGRACTSPAIPRAARAEPWAVSPVNAFQQHRQLRGRQRNPSGVGDRPLEVAVLQPLAEQAQALPVEPKQLDQAAAFAAKGEQGAAERVFFLHLLASIARPSIPLRMSV
jgi:hypothetical protein